MDAATHGTRVPFQRRHAFTGRHVPQLERAVVRPRHDAPPVREHGNAKDLRRRHIITKVQWTPQRTAFECPSSVARHSPVAMSHTLSVLSQDADTTRRPSGEMATPQTYDEDTSSQKYSGRRATHVIRVPSQRRHAFTGRHVPHLERLVARRRYDAPPVRRDSNAIDLQQRHIIAKVQWTPQRTALECPFSVATHSPVATSHTLSVLPSDPDTTRRPSGNTATLKTYNKARSSQKYSGRRNARHSSALSASPRTRRSPRPTP